MPRQRKRFSFAPSHETLREVLSDKQLAGLGDSYVNLLYSLYLSAKERKPVGAQVDTYTLSTALKRAGLRCFLPSRVSRHTQADAAEAALVYAWLHGLTTITNSLELLLKREDVVEGFSSLLCDLQEKLDSA